MDMRESQKFKMPLVSDKAENAADSETPVLSGKELEKSKLVDELVDLTLKIEAGKKEVANFEEMMDELKAKMEQSTEKTGLVYDEQTKAFHEYQQFHAESMTMVESMEDEYKKKNAQYQLVFGAPIPMSLENLE